MDVQESLQLPGIRPSRKKTYLFRLLSLALGLLLLFLVEGLLRLFGFGGHPQLWRVVLENEETGQVLLENDARALQPFFPHRTKSGAHAQGSFRYERVLMPKPEGLLRVAIVGESSVEGFPFPRSLTAASFLQAYLQALHPGQPIEVLNLGVTAVASYPVRIVAEQSLASLDLDLLVVYTGHNEFYGASGVASRQSGLLRLRGTDVSYLLRSTAIWQTAGHVTGRFEEKSYKRPEDTRLNLIEEMARIPRIEPGGFLHHKAASVLEHNLHAMIHTAHKRGVPVVLCTLTSNESDLRPIQVWGVDFDESDRVADQALAILNDEDEGLDFRIAELESLLNSYPSNAMVHWVRGTLLARLGRQDEALESWSLARDFDGMPWRATRAINEVIRRVAKDRDVLLVDIEEAFQNSADGPVGWEYMADHLHPNLKGQTLMGETIARAIAENSLLPGAHPETSLPPAEELARVLGANRLELGTVYQRMADLFTYPPLGLRNADAEQILLQKVETFISDPDAIESEAIDRWNAALSESSHTPSISYLAGLVAMDAGEHQRAAEYFSQARAAMTSFGTTRLRATYLALLCKRAEGPLEGRMISLLHQAVSEGAYVEKLAEPPDLARLASTLGGLYVLAGVPGQGVSLLGKGERAGFVMSASEAEILQSLLDESPRRETVPE